MEWTDERVELLKQMWDEGATARQIAEKLGGVSRNAVIGKANRIGLSKPTKSAITRKAKQKERQEETAFISQKGATILSLTTTTCRWPIGHPGEPGFHFCGVSVSPAQIYCDAHCRIAYQAPNKDSRRRIA